MIGKIVPPNRIVLDYTEVARPLDTDIIRKDVTEVCAEQFRDVSEIVMWEHQRDWIAKPYIKKGRRSSYYLFEVEPEAQTMTSTLLGIPVRLAE